MNAADPSLKTEEAANFAVDPEPPPPPQVSWRRRWANNLVFIPLLALATVGFGSVSLICGLWDKSGRQQHAVANLWARTLLRIALSPVTVEHAERLPSGAAVYACNHLSYYDTPVLFAKLPFQFRILAKASLWKIPFIGWYLNRSAQVPIDQSSARAGVASLGRGARTLAAGMPLVVFPEGGRAANGELQPMVAGAAWMAIKAQVPLVPITLVGTYEMLPIHVYALKPRPLKLIVGEPISTQGMSTREAEALTERLFAVIHQTYVAQQS
ncbi:MAG: lysophospholipid acyltransferase family protein [Acidobacteriaceae bacterium]